MGSLSDPSTIIDERYRAERAALKPLMAAPRGRFAYARYWLGRLRVEMLFKVAGERVDLARRQARFHRSGSKPRLSAERFVLP
jgi:hypothetical protein